jgi:hypothetical protein
MKMRGALSMAVAAGLAGSLPEVEERIHQRTPRIAEVVFLCVLHVLRVLRGKNRP